MRKKLSLSTINDRLRQKHGDLVSIDYATYVNANTPAKFIDVEFGEWWAQPGSVFRGSRHKKRAEFSRRIPVNEINDKLKSVHGSCVKLVESTYVHTYKKCTFVDEKFGEWQAYPHNVLNGSTHPKRGLECRKSTWKQKYGVDNPFKSTVIQEKALRSGRHVTRVKHWRSGETLVCVGSYEVAFVNWCNANEIDFDWQIWHTTPWKKRYRIDAKILSGQYADTWIEIKGYFRDDDSKRKWEWFHANHKSELWNQDRLKEIGIL